MAAGGYHTAELAWNISNELTLLIFGELDPESLLACRLVCRHFDNVVVGNASHLVNRVTSASTHLSTAALCFPRSIYEPLIASAAVVPQWRVPTDPASSRELYDAFPPWKLPLLTYDAKSGSRKISTALRYLQMLQYRVKKVDEVYNAVQRWRSAAKSPLKLSLRLLWRLSDIKGVKNQQCWYKTQPRVFADLLRHVMLEYRKVLHRRIRRRHPECLKPETIGMPLRYVGLPDGHENPVVSEIMNRMKEDDTRRRILGALHVALISLTQQRGPLFFLDVQQWNMETMWSVKYELKRNTESYSSSGSGGHAGDGGNHLDFGDQSDMPAHDNSDLTKEEWEYMLKWTEGDEEPDWDREDILRIVGELCAGEEEEEERRRREGEEGEDDMGSSSSGQTSEAGISPMQALYNGAGVVV